MVPQYVREYYDKREEKRVNEVVKTFEEKFAKLQEVIDQYTVKNTELINTVNKVVKENNEIKQSLNVVSTEYDKLYQYTTGSQNEHSTLQNNYTAACINNLSKDNEINRLEQNTNTIKNIIGFVMNNKKEKENTTIDV